MPTLADRWRETKPATFTSMMQYLYLVQMLDAGCVFQKTAEGCWSVFSDGSHHLMGGFDAHTRPRA